MFCTHLWTTLQPGCLERPVSMEDHELTYSEGEQQISPQPFLEEEENAAGQFSDVEGPWEEYELEEKLFGGDEMGTKDTSGDVEDQSDSSTESLEHSLGDISNTRALLAEERIHIAAVQRNIKLLDDMVKEKKLVVQKTGQKLCACQLRIKMLAKQLDRVDMEIEREKEAGNVPALSRLQAVSRRLRSELEREKESELIIDLKLDQDKMEMWQIEIEQGKYEVIRDKLQQEEEQLQKHYQEQREGRIRKEKRTALQAEGKRRSREQKEEKAQKEHEERKKKILEDAKRNHKKAACFLKQSTARIHDKIAKEEEKTQEHMERRIQAVLSLKTSITSNREKLQTLQVLNKAKALEAEKEKMKMREAILAEGGNVVQEIFLHKRQLKHEKEEQAFRELQKSRKIEIVSRILKEEASFHKQKESQSRIRATKARGKVEDPSVQRKEAWPCREETCTRAGGATAQESWLSPSPPSLAGEGTAPEGGSPEDTAQDVLWESGDDEKEKEKTLLEPEFPGLWGQEYDLHKIPKEEVDPTQLAIRALKKEVSENKMEEFQTGSLAKQTVPGREHKGCAFHSKPSCIHFKDFDVGQTYKKKIILTNASYSVNYCRLVGISECLKDFISVHFDPPGKMSSGMSCEFVVTFKPMINESLAGEVMFVAQTGSFSVPLQCTVKSCVLALDKELIDFGSHVVGETISRAISLTNSGALGTGFKVQASAGDRSTHGATVKPAPGRMVPRHSSGCDPEEEGSSSPGTAGLGKQVQICAEPGEEVTPCAAQEPQGPQSSSATEQLDQEVLSMRSDLDTDNARDSVELSPEETPVEIMLGKVTEGEVGPFSSVQVPVLFVPAVPGDVRAEFVIMFDNPDCKPLCFSAVGVSVDVPLWVPNPDVDLKICLYDRLYQDCVTLRSRASTTLRFKFEVCKELSKHLELLPRTGYIQAQSAFSAQLKFLPRQSLPEDAGNYFNAETRILEVPVTIVIMDKARTVNFTVHAIVSTSDLEISPAEINFGHCTIYEAVQANVTVTNKCLLPQEFGFVGLPEFVEVQPNDGFGVILPLESLTLDIIFKATKAKEYSFDLTCTTEINRQFKLSCKAVGVHPPLELSHSLVQFAATALNSVSEATLDVLNPHVSGNSLIHAVPRIGTGEPAPVGPTSFEFHVPEDCPVTITPSVGTVLPGQKSSIRVSFSPALPEQLVREEAARRLSRAAVPEAGIQIPSGDPQGLLDKEKKNGKREGKKLSISIPKQPENNGGRKSLTGEPKPEELKPDSDAYRAAQASLMRSFSGSFKKYIIPCFVASGQAAGEKGSGHLSCSPYNTLYLELHCPAVAPPVLVTSDSGDNMVGFGDVSVGHRTMKRITLQNISLGRVGLGFSALNPNGPFLLVRAVRMLEPGESKALVISFCPEEDKWFCETLDIRVANSTLSLSLSGHGVVPGTVCSVEGVLDMGYVMAGEQVTSTVLVQNTSSLALPFCTQLDSLSPTRDRDRQNIPAFLSSSGQRTEFVGTQNYSGLSVFSVFPTEGEIEAGKSQEFVVTFSPDHESLYYSDRLRVVLFGKQTAHEVPLRGAAREHPMFVEGGVPLDVPVESLAVTSSVASQEALTAEPQEPVRSLLLLLESVDGGGPAEPARAELRVGAVDTPLLAAKKAVEFSLDSLPELERAGIAVEEPRGALERGQERSIRVSWAPPAELSVSDPPLVTALLTLKGDITVCYRVLFMARVVSACAPTP
ncbi:PREDICTED: cilia- and flagella-associated protein 74 isoform X1 [Lepidothrix coronata]|uniref:Cilia- and flagella-associated protein 74 isoform X1 n=2 Tax=Lepidothrix coronata TaxID=321398 RepID=A0A6J0IJ90_9PASS|nr:PREDICTED: cilia- and flagella-associated protein 74 isoform X1 [Lepidothrix coronata]XP_017686724.1 PREDICTED: cilia- and flagella-associated protein 74 isoform X1 [Lepidothrix coronata]XP_017686725.1 PREDICTED: cilia- and flagella-associated protein 74 isoform X1 [Lepidothrix coronata]XP_017686726.1 PREDICTED: cilia- and flagella-associated protein 74 isoform X1 [Lepidothrix coronata]